MTFHTNDLSQSVHNLHQVLLRLTLTKRVAAFASESPCSGGPPHRAHHCAGFTVNPHLLTSADVRHHPDFPPTCIAGEPAKRVSGSEGHPQVALWFEATPLPLRILLPAAFQAALPVGRRK